MNLLLPPAPETDPQGAVFPWRSRLPGGRQTRGHQMRGHQGGGRRTLGHQRRVRRGWLLAALAVLLPPGGALPLAVRAQGLERGAAAPAAAVVPAAPGRVELLVRRQGGSTELVLQGVGQAPMLQQSSRDGRWFGALQVSAPTALRRGPQVLALPDLGLQSIQLSGGGSTYALQVTPMAGVTLGRPVVSADGRDLILVFPQASQPSQQTLQPSALAPGLVPQPRWAPPLRPRAVAPPVGDMAVGSLLLANPSYLNVRGPAITMTLKDAPAKDVLMTLARYGGYGFAYVEDFTAAGATATAATGSGTASSGAVPTTGERRVSIAFRGESYGRAVNAALMAAGLQGKLEGNTIYAGPRVLGKTFGAQLSKVYRLNQVSANAAADYLANLGASVSKTNTITTAVTQGSSQTTAVQGGVTAATTQSSTQTTVETYGASNGPLLGLLATTDTRLSSITLVGAPTLVTVAEHYLRQLDLRQRQVALSLKILDITLDNDSALANSFAFRWGNNFIINDNGNMAGVFGSRMPPSLLPLAPTAGLAPQFSAPTSSPGTGYPQQFFDFVRAQIVSDNTKVLASPTLILQENPALLREDGGSASDAATASTSGQQTAQNITLNTPIGRRRANEGVVRVGENVVTGYSTNTTQGAISCVPTFSTAGLVLGARVEKIDDNGFVTFTLSPSISAVVDSEVAPTGCGARLNILSIRSLDTGSVRVRDGQTLVLTGVISDADRAEVRKWPILGDIPFIGQFFRGTSTSRKKRELVILASPRIINDDQGGTYGYGYQPSMPESQRLMGGASGLAP